MKKPVLSIIIVHFQVEPILWACVRSLLSNEGNHKLEIIVVDNGSLTGFAQRLKSKFPQIKYLAEGSNLGYGAGNNLGARSALGELLFFLNPDTVLEKQTIKHLLAFWKKHPQAGIVAPTLLHPDGKLFAEQGSLTLTPFSALAAHSIFHRLWPDNPVAQKFWLVGVKQTVDRQTEVVPGTAFTIRRSLFFSLGGFDPKYFLYFEEYDLCRRVLAKRKQIWMSGSARLIHRWGATSQGANLSRHYQASFHYYLTKFYGPWLGEISYLLTQLTSWQLALLVIGLVYLIF